MFPNNSIQVSEFWNYKEFESRHFRHENNSSKIKDRKVGPFYFEQPVDSKTFRKYLRETLGVSNSEHLEVWISINSKENERCKKSYLDVLAKEKAFEERENERKKLILLGRIKPKKRFKTIKVSMQSFVSIVKSNLGGSAAAPNGMF